MKTAAKVYIYIGMIFGFFLIYPIVLGSKALRLLDSATKKQDLRNIGTLILLLDNPVAGKILSLIDDSDLSSNLEKNKTRRTNTF